MEPGKKKGCSITGHRNLPKEKRAELRSRLREEILLAIADGFTLFISGMADGTDLMFVDILHELQETYPDIYIEAAVPYASRIKRLERVLPKCNGVYIFSQKYLYDYLINRNKYIMGQSERVIALYDGREKGGTVFMMEYARSLGRDVRVIRY